MSTVFRTAATASHAEDTGERGGAAVDVRKVNTSDNSNENTVYSLLLVECSEPVSTAVQSRWKEIGTKVLLPSFHWICCQLHL